MHKIQSVLLRTQSSGDSRRQGAGQEANQHPRLG